LAKTKLKQNINAMNMAFSAKAKTIYERDKTREIASNLWTFIFIRPAFSLTYWLIDRSID